MIESRPAIQAVLFDLDGVLVSTDELHFEAWSEIARQEGIPFTRLDNDRLRGVSRMESLEIVLERSPRRHSPEAKLALAEAKNARYAASLLGLGPNDVLPGTRSLLDGLRQRSIRTAVASASRNARLLLERLELTPLLDAVVDGNDVTRSKPDPEVFLLAARRLAIPPERCLVVEDAAAGVEAARRGGFRTLGIGPAGTLPKAVRTVPSLAAITIEELLAGTP